MKKTLATLVFIGVAATTAISAHARDDKLLMPISVAMESSDTKEKLDSSIKYYSVSYTHLTLPTTPYV